MKRRQWLQRAGALGAWASLGGIGLGLTACGGGDDDDEPGAYRQTALVANKASYGALFTDAEFINAWGIAIRPAGAGGHFWVAAGGTSWEFLGDVQESDDPALRSLTRDALTEVAVPAADALIDDSSIGKATGTVFNGAPLDGDLFVVSGQQVEQGGTTIVMEGSARFLFATDSGSISAWTDRRRSDGSIVRANGPAVEMIDGSAQGMAFFGIALKTDTWDRLWAADFGSDPQIRSYDADWQPLETAGFVNPFASGPLRDAARPELGRRPLPGDPVPFNIQVLDSRVFIAYCISQEDPESPGNFYAAEEDALDAAAEQASSFRPDRGKLVEYALDGTQVRIFEDDGRLNAPWGLALAPDDFGALSNALLVGNFGGGGLICAYDAGSGRFIDHLRLEDGERAAIPGLWGLQFGNGVSLGDSNALYFAAGPADETDGLFGSLRVAD